MRAINFGAGPGALPLSVLERVRDEMLDFGGTGMSVGELSHRSKQFKTVLDEAERDLRLLLDIPSNYKVLFMQGGGTGQFAAVPLNLVAKGQRADYLVTGTWSKGALAEAAKFCDAREVASAPPFVHIPPQDTWKCSPDAAYLYACTNETVNGILFDPAVDAKLDPSTVLIADMSSEILTRKIDVSKYGLIFAGAQKNIGISGITVVIVRASLLGKPSAECPVIMDYTVTAANESLFNTPPTFPIYVAGLVFKWCLQMGGIDVLEKQSREKAQAVYDVVDRHPQVYLAPVAKEVRSRTNVVFRFVNPELEPLFLAQASKEGMIGLQGHRSVGGIRVSLYNAVSLEDSQRVAALLERFALEHQK